MKLPFLSGFLTTRKLVILLCWYAVAMLVAVFTFSHMRWKEESNLLRVYNSLFYVPSEVPLIRDAVTTRNMSLAHRGNTSHLWNNDSSWQPFDPETGEFRYRYASRTYPQRTRSLDALKQTLLSRTGNSSLLSSLVLIRNISNGRLLSETFHNSNLWPGELDSNAKGRTSNASLVGVLQQLVGSEVDDLLRAERYNSYNSSMLLAAIEQNMQKIRKETEISLKHLTQLTGILNMTVAGNVTLREFDERMRSSVNSSSVVGGERKDVVLERTVQREGSSENKVLKLSANDRTKQRSESADKVPAQRKKGHPSLLSVLIGQGLLAENKPQTALRSSITRQLTKNLDVNSTSANTTGIPNTTEIPEVEGYYRIDTRMKLRLQCSTCAVISSSGQLLNSSAGSLIDTYPCVIRMNSAPTSGFENDVGAKTTVRVMGHVNLLKVNQSDSEQTEIFINKTTRTEKLIIPWLYTTRINKRRDKHYNIAKNFSKVFPDTEFYVLSSAKMMYAESVFQHETGISRKDAKTWLSTGWMTLLFALDVCQQIDVFGLVPDNFCKEHPNDTTPYHYYDTEFKSQCTYYKESEEHLTFGHLFVTEKAIFGRWAQKYNINFLHPKWNLTALNTSAPLETPFLKLFHEAQLNKTRQKLPRQRSFLGARIRPRKPPMIGPKTREETEKEKYQKFTHAIMFIVAIFLSLVVFLLLFLLVSIHAI